MGKAKAKAAQEAASETESSRQTALGVVREWTDALVIAFVLAMFIRTFVVELFKIPSGSMTPTLVGTEVSLTGTPEEYAIEWDVSDPPDGEKDLILDRPHGRYPRYHVFYRKNGKFVANEERDDLRLPLEARRHARKRNDRIIVNKFAYWFHRPRRGEIVVFRVPPCIYQRDKPIYVKRVVGLPGDLVEIRHPHIYVNGRLLDEPEVFLRTEYVNRFGSARGNPDYRPDYIEWHVEREGFANWEWFDRARVPENYYFLLGDNSKSSRDSRDWGAVHQNNLKGKAILRYWPLTKFGFLE